MIVPGIPITFPVANVTVILGLHQISSSDTSQIRSEIKFSFFAIKPHSQGAWGC